MNFIVGKKLNMSQYFAENGEVIPVTVVQVAPMAVTQVKSASGKDKYNAVQVAVAGSVAGNKRGKKSEFRVADAADYQTGQNLDVSTFQIGEIVDCVGTMKGRGFAGAMKRHGFHGFPASHGHDRPRSVGSIGQRFPQHVRKGMRMAGHMGTQQVTVKNLQVVEVDANNNLLTLKGAVPGHRNALLRIISTGKVKPLFRAVVEKEEKKKK